jgi:hypothetical protein
VEGSTYLNFTQGAEVKPMLPIFGSGATPELFYLIAGRTTENKKGGSRNESTFWQYG